MIIQDPGDAGRGLRQLFQAHQRNDFDHLAGWQGVAIRADFKKKQEHGDGVSNRSYAAIFHSPTPSFKPWAAWVNCPIAWLDSRRDWAVCWAASLSCDSASLICCAPVACDCMPSLTD